MSIYFDNAATSFPKPSVVSDAVTHFIEVEGGSPGRGFHSAALEADRTALACRQNIARLLNIEDSSRICFFLNATQAINQGLTGLTQCRRIVSTSMEHNAVLRPLYRMRALGAELSFVQASADGVVAPEAVIRKAENVQADLVVLQHASNVTGSIHNIAPIAEWCRNEGALLMVDASQTVGHMEIDIQSLGVDLLAAPGHKGLLGPQGTGFLYVRSGLSLVPQIVGGTGGQASDREMPDEMPQALEAGTLNLPGLAGLKASVEWILKEGVANLQQTLHQRMLHLRSGLEKIDGVRIFGPGSSEANCGILSIHVDGKDPAAVGFQLDRDYGIQVRVGLHCAPEAHRSLGTWPEGTLRFSPGVFTTEDEVDKVVEAVQTIVVS